MSFISEPEFFGGDVEDIELRSYQEESIDILRANIRRGCRAQILASMCGSGKTVMGAYLLRECWQKKRNGIFVVDRISLLDQTSEHFDRFGIPHGIVQSDHPRRRPGELIQIVAIQTIARRGWPKADLIINDEAHVMHKTMLDKIARNDAVVVGLTATPFSDGMGKHYKAIVNVTTGNKLTQEGFLVPFREQVWDFDSPNMEGVKVVAGEWDETEGTKRVLEVTGSAVQAYMDKGQGRKTIVFGWNVAHCEALQRDALKAGINAQLYTYHTPKEERDALIGRNGEFRKPDSSVRWLISVDALSRGFDVQDVGCVILAKPIRKSLTAFIQTISRGIRSHHSKTDCVMIDHAKNFFRHYAALEDFMEEGVHELDDGKKKESKPAPKKERKSITCPKCKHVFLGGSSCPACGFMLAPKKSIEHVNGELKQFDGVSVLKLDREAKCKLFSELKFICESNGYKPGWAAWKYKAITNVWPNGFKDVEPQIPSRATLALVDSLKPYKPNRRALEPRREVADLFA